MTERVDFYVLKSSSAKQRWTVGCRLTEKAYLRDLRVLVLSGTAADAEAIDELLWTFNDRSFIPHAISRDGSLDAATPVHLLDVGSMAAFDRGPADLLVNLSDTLPGGLERFARIAEVIDADEERRRLGRERFKVYRELKVPLETHQLDDAADGG
jgi:DNA polymerase-3 subunit chi